MRCFTCGGHAVLLHRYLHLQCLGERLDIGRYEWGQDMAEFIAIGTAVKHRDGVLHRAPNGRPFTSDLSGQDFWTLLRTGHRPVGMVMGS